MKKWEEQQRLRIFNNKAKNTKSKISQPKTSTPSTSMKGSDPYQSNQKNQNFLSEQSENEKQDPSKVPLYKILKLFNLQQYTRALISRGFGYKINKFNLLSHKEIEQLIIDINVLPGHQIKLMNLIEYINEVSEEVGEAQTQTLILNPNDDATWFNKGIALQNLRKYKEAVEAYTQALNLNPKDYATWYNKGVALDNLRKHEEAVEAYTQALNLNPKQDKIWCYKGIALQNLRKYQEAVEAYNQALILNPKKDKAWYNKGEALNKLGKYQEAVEAYNQALILNPKKDEAWHNKGEALNKLGKYQEVLDCYNMAIQICPKSNIYYNKGLALESLQKNEEALQSFQEALKLNPNDVDAKNKVDKLQGQLNQFEEQKQQKNEKAQKGLFIKQLVKSEQDLFAGQFISKLSLDQAFEWAQKFLTLQTQNMNEVCCYYQHIFPLLISSNEAQSIQIEQINAKRGGFAMIHYGQFRSQSIAIKEQIFAQSDDAEFISMLREISIQIYCDHPNISKILAVYFDPSQLKIWTVQARYAMDLHEALFDQRKQIPNKQQLLIQLLSALDYIHNLGFIHLDIKPKNLMFETEACKKIFLLDFGIMKFEKNAETEMLGMSHYYSAPEVSITNKALVSTKSDIFSFGIFLYEFTTARRAWQNHLTKGGQAIQDLIKGNFSFFKENNSTGNQSLDKLILDCVEKNPQKRPTAKDAIDKISSIKF